MKHSNSEGGESNILKEGTLTPSCASLKKRKSKLLTLWFLSLDNCNQSGQRKPVASFATNIS